MKDLRGYLLIMIAAVFWGCSATAAKALLNQEIDTVLIVQTRVVFSSLLLLLFYMVFKPHLLRVKSRDLWRLALLGVLGVAGSNFTYYFTIKQSTVATAIILQYTAPLLVMGYTTLMGEERFTVLKLTAAVTTLAGCFLVVGAFDTSVVRLNASGLVSGIGSMVSFAFLNIYTRHILRRYNVWTTTFYAISFASMFWLIVNPPWRVVLHSPPAGTWGWLVVLAVTSILVPHSLYFAGMQYVVASRAIITSTLEPVVAMASAAVFLAEGLHPVQVVGALMVVSTILLLQVRREEERIRIPVAARDAHVS